MEDLCLKRIKKLEKWMISQGIDSFLVSNPENRFYLSGFFEKDLSPMESSGVLLITSSSRFIITDFRYKEAAEKEAPLFEVIIYEKSLYEAISKLAGDLGLNFIGIERDYVTVAFFEELRKTLSEKDIHVEVVPYSGVVEEMRAVKDNLEIELIKKSLELSESVMEDVPEFVKCGMSEEEVAWALEKSIREKGAEDIAFSPIVASGPNSARPHAKPTSRVPLKGEPLIVDMGARLNGYCSDITRTFFMDSMPEEWKKIYEVVLEAQRAAQEAIKPGMKTTEVDGIARQIIEDAGYGSFFGHGLGHGVGLSVHERPSLRKQKPVVIEKNMVVTIEPGIYLPGKGGVRLENMILVTENGGKVLNKIDLPWVVK